MFELIKLLRIKIFEAAVKNDNLVAKFTEIHTYIYIYNITR